MDIDRKTCAKVRAELLEQSLSRTRSFQVAGDLAAHLAVCRLCQRYWSGLQASRHLFPQTGLYSARLQARTLQGLEETESKPGPFLLLALLLLAFIGLAVQFLSPVWLLSRWAQSFEVSTVWAWAVAFTVVTLLGTMSSLACALVVHRRQVSDENWIGKPEAG
ncbi:MAG: hypothetical protein AB1898_13830 [Acidobacteriota bacterium]